MERAPEQIGIWLPSKLLVLGCVYDTRLRTVTDAGLAERRPLTDAQIGFIRNAGFCTNDPAKLRVAIEQGEKVFFSGGATNPDVEMPWPSKPAPSKPAPSRP